MIKRLTTLGNSSALIIDKPILELLHITPQTDLRITTDGRSLNIAPVGQVASEAEFREVQKHVMARHAHTFKKLAESDQ